MNDSPSFLPTIEVRSPQPNASLVILGGEHDLASADLLRQTFEESLASSDHLIVDLSGAAVIDSTIVGVLVQTMRRTEELDRKFTVVLGTAPAVERILGVTGLLELITVVPTLELALAA